MLCVLCRQTEHAAGHELVGCQVPLCSGCVASCHSQRLQLPADLLLSRPLLSSLPPPAMQAFLPPELLLSAGGQVGQGLQLLSASQLIQPRAIEQSSEGPLRFWPA